MAVACIFAAVNAARLLEQYFDRLWPLCRSITGHGLRQSLAILQELLPLSLTEVPTGTQVFDWTIPDEWYIRDAWIETPQGERICRFHENNLHVVNYSSGVNGILAFDELDKHLHHLPAQPDAVPYITSYYNRQWGFCLTEKEYVQQPREGLYKVFIDAGHKAGSLTYGEAVLQGSGTREILFSTYVCHPSMAVNELSGPLVTALLYRLLAAIPNRKHTYRFLFAPETIGVLAWLNTHGAAMKEKLLAGYVVTCTGHDAPLTYKLSKRENTAADIIALRVLNQCGEMFNVIPFAIGGSDERQYCSPGFNLPVGSLMRTPYKAYPEYHTSLDNKSIISFDAMVRTAEVYADIAMAFEQSEFPRSTIPHGEPQLGKRGLYPASGAWQNRQALRLNILHLLSYADGHTDLQTIAEKRGVSLAEMMDALQVCKQHGLV